MQQCTNYTLFSFRFFFALTLVLGLALVFSAEADATKAQGKSGWKYGSATAGIVCGDKLCSENSKPAMEEKVQVTKDSPPLAQFKNGIALSQVECDEGLLLVIKNSNGNPACIKPDSVETLFSRGWASPVMIN